MKYLKQRHIPMAIATSSYREEIMPTINALGIDEYVDVIVGREDVEAVKPDPELYLTAVQRLNYSPAHCLAIEDSANGATGAMNAGLDVIINTNEMTEAQDFSAITFVGKDLSFEQIKIVSLNQIRSKLMSWQIILFFLAYIIIGIGNLVLIFSKHIPFKVQMRSFLVGTIYLLLATIGYYLLLQGRI